MHGAGAAWRLPAPRRSGRRERLLEWIVTRRAGWACENAAPVALEAGLLNPREVVRTAQRLAGSEVLLLGEPGTPTLNIASYTSMPGSATSGLSRGRLMW